MTLKQWQETSFFDQHPFSGALSDSGKFQFRPTSPYLEELIGLEGETESEGRLSVVRLWFDSGALQHRPIAQLVSGVVEWCLGSLDISPPPELVSQFQPARLQQLFGGGGSFNFSGGQARFAESEGRSFLELSWGASDSKRGRSFLGFKW